MNLLKYSHSKQASRVKTLSLLSFVLVESFPLPSFAEGPNWTKLERVGKAWICPDSKSPNQFYTMPSYLTVKEFYHENIDETNESIYKFKIASALTDHDYQNIYESILHRTQPREISDGMTTLPLTYPGFELKLTPMPVQKIELMPFKLRNGQPFDYSIPLEKIYFSGDLMHWAIPSHIILKVNQNFEPSFGELLQFQKILPYQYEVTVFKDVKSPLYVQYTLPEKGDPHE